MEKIKLLDVEETQHFNIYFVSLQYPDEKEPLRVEFSGTDIGFNIAIYSTPFDDVFEITNVGIDQNGRLVNFDPRMIENH
jgi:hypothetical protein